jgi:predicted metal-dependent HD superfamily phosphohydrolase
MNDELLSAAKEKVTKIFKEEVKPIYTYHNLTHTLKVVSAATTLANHAQITEDEKEMLLLAAYFHDTGFVQGQENHELRSAKMADEWLESQNYPIEKREIISGVINSTRREAMPESELGKLLKDADLSGLSSRYYAIESENLREEWENLSGEEIDDLDWLRTNLEFHKEHQYLSIAGIALYNSGKRANQKILKKKIKDVKNEIKTISNSRSAQTQFKTALRNHIDLSAIADNKANIMLSVNALIITVAMPVIAGQVAGNTKLLLPAIILLTVCVSSMIYATLATRPIKMKGVVRPDEIKAGKSNLFFFGNFYMMNYKDYEAGIRQVLSDEEYLDASITRDLFFLGKSIGNKFANLRKCYNIFMYGMVIAVIAFVIAFILG